jgi:hypothetical protein
MKIRTPNTGSDAFNVWLETGDDIEGGYVVSGYSEPSYMSPYAATRN